MFGFFDFVDQCVVDFVGGDFVQCQYGWFVFGFVVVQCGLYVVGELMGMFGCYYDQFEMVVNDFQVIFYGDVGYMGFW